MDILLEYVDSLYDLLISTFNWMDKNSAIADWLSSIATVMATGTAFVFIKKRTPKNPFQFGEWECI